GLLVSEVPDLTAGSATATAAATTTITKHITPVTTLLAMAPDAAPLLPGQFSAIDLHGSSASRSLRKPGSEFSLGKRLDGGNHGRMAGTAVLGTEQIVAARFRGYEPGVVAHARHNIPFDPEGWQEKTVDHVL